MTAERRNLFRGRLLMVAAAFLWSLSGFFAKSDWLQGVPPLVLACGRVFGAAACLLPTVPWGRVRWRVGLIPMVICFALMNVLFVTALSWSSSAAAIFLQYTSTFWTFLFGVLILKEPIERGQISALVFGLAGIAVIVIGSWQADGFAGNLLALGAGVAYAGVIISLRSLQEEDSRWLITLNMTVSGLVLLPWVMTSLGNLTPTQGGILLVWGGIQMGLPYVLFALALRYVSAQEGALGTLLEPLLIPVWTALAWGERVDIATLWGAGLIMTGLVVRYACQPRAVDNA